MTSPPPRFRTRTLIALFVLLVAAPCLYFARLYVSDSPLLTAGLMLMAALAALALWLRNTPGMDGAAATAAPAAPLVRGQPLATPQQAAAFFRDPSKQRHSLKAVFAELGEPGNCYDTDFGRREYAWTGSGPTVRLYTRNSTANVAVTVGRMPFSTHETVIWTNPDPDELGGRPR